MIYYGTEQSDSNWEGPQWLTLNPIKSPFGTDYQATIRLQHVAHTIHLYKNVGTASGNNINYVTKPQPFSLQNHNYPRSSPPPSSSSTMCEIDTRFEILPLIFSLYRNRPNRGPADEPRGSMPIVGSSGSSSQDTEDLQAIKLKVQVQSLQISEDIYTQPIRSCIAQLAQPGIDSPVASSRLIDARPVFFLQ